MPIQFTREEIEADLNQAVSRGRIREIARLAQMGESIVYGYFNADDERESPASKLLRLQAAMDAIDPAMGDDHWNRLCAMREASRMRKHAGRTSADHELGQTSKEFADIVVSRCEGKPVSDQLREIAEARMQLDRLREAILDDVATGTHVN